MKLDEVILRDTRANQPAAADTPAGALYYVTDEEALERNSGSAWQSVSAAGSFYGSPFTAPVDGDFAWTNQGGASVTAASDGSILLSAPATAGDSLRIRRQAAPSTPYTLTVYIQPLTGDQGASGSTFGIGFRQNSDGKLHVLMCDMNYSGGSIYSTKFTNETTFSAAYSSSTYAALNISPQQSPIRWLRITDNGTNRLTYWSLDGHTWTQLTTVGRTDFLTADQILFFANSADASIAATIRLWSWLES